MTCARHHPWDDAAVPAVPVAALSAAIGLRLARERAGLVLVDATRFSTLEQIEARIIAMHDHPARGLAVLVRTRSLMKALSLRRFRHLVKRENATRLATLIEAAARQRVSARWGMSAAEAAPPHAVAA